MLHKSALIEMYREDFNSSRADAQRTVEWFLDAIKGELKDGGVVRFAELGTMTTMVRKGGKRRNPQTGGSIMVPDKTTVRLKPSKTFVAELNA